MTINIKRCFAVYRRLGRLGSLRQRGAALFMTCSSCSMLPAEAREFARAHIWIAEVVIVVGRALQHVFSGRLRAGHELFGLIRARLDIYGTAFRQSC